MANREQRGNKETRKPKKDKGAKPSATPTPFGSVVKQATAAPKGKPKA